MILICKAMLIINVNYQTIFINMRKTLFNAWFIHYYLIIEAFLGILALSVFIYSDNSAREVIAHFTGIITLINLVLAFFLIWQVKSITSHYMAYYLLNRKAWKITGMFGCIFMITGYVLYLFEKVSPYAHAWASLNFDIATTLMANSLQLISYALILGNKNE